MTANSDAFYENPAIVGSLLHKPRTSLALTLANATKARRILDLGCGDGAIAAELAESMNANVIGADVSALAAQRCSERGIEAHQVSAGEEPLPFPDQSFVLVFMTEVLEHLVHPYAAMQEVRRVLAPNGHLVLSTPNLACLPNRLLLLMGLQPVFTEVSEHLVLGRGFRMLGQRGQPVGHLRLYTNRALREFLESCG